MASSSNIEWTDHTWNPVVGCSIVSPGCTNCYAMRWAYARLDRPKGLPHYAGTTEPSKAGGVWTGKVAIAPEHILNAPLRWKKPRRIFVNSMGDLFHESIPDEWIDRVFAVMALCPQHTFQVLTKRAERMRDYFLGKERYRDVHPLEDRADAIDKTMDAVAPAHWCTRELQDYSEEGLPLPNVWLGVSCERQQEYEERWPYLRITPAAIRFISYEPALGPLKFLPFPHPLSVPGPLYPDWLICGGESGHNARPMHPQWARDIQRQCEAADVKFFFKQFGEWLPWSQFVYAEAVNDDPEQTKFATQEWRNDTWMEVGYPMWCDAADGNVDDQHCVARVGKKAAGRLLDGREWNEFPQVRA